MFSLENHVFYKVSDTSTLYMNKHFNELYE